MDEELNPNSIEVLDFETLGWKRVDTGLRLSFRRTKEIYAANVLNGGGVTLTSIAHPSAPITKISPFAVVAGLLLANPSGTRRKFLGLF